MELWRPGGVYLSVEGYRQTGLRRICPDSAYDGWGRNDVEAVVCASITSLSPLSPIIISVVDKRGDKKDDPATHKGQPLFHYAW